MLWIVLGVSTVISVVVIWAILSSPPDKPAPPERITPNFGDAELARAAVELYAIRRRLDTALTRSELSRETDRLRHELAEEMRRIEVLEARGGWDE